MKRFERDSVIVALIEALRQNGSWCGETHVQKTLYFLQELLCVPLKFEYLLYKHGPYSFELSDALGQMCANRFIRYEVRPYPYGPTLEPDKNSAFLRKHHGDTLDKYKAKIDFLAQNLASKNVVQLEQIGTAMYVTLEKPKRTSEKRAQRICCLKPHIPLDTAKTALQEFDAIRHKAKRFAS